VFQQHHKLEKAGQQQMEKQLTETKEQNKTAPAPHDKHDDQQQNLPSARDTDSVSVSTGAQHKRDEVDAPEKSCRRKGKCGDRMTT